MTNCSSTADIEVQFVQLNHCDGVLSISLKYLICAIISQHTTISLCLDQLSFVDSYPDIQALAEARQKDFLRVWALLPTSLRAEIELKSGVIEPSIK